MVLYKNIAGRFFGLVTKHACNRRTDGQNYDSQDLASIAESRGKNRDAQKKRSSHKAVESVLRPEGVCGAKDL